MVGITKNEHEVLIELICDIVNDSDDDQFYENPECTNNLLNELDRLDSKYGEMPMLISTRADFTDDVKIQIKLYKKAIQLALKSGDISTLVMAAESLVEIYVSDYPNSREALEWFDKLKIYNNGYGDKYIISTYPELKAKINRMGIKVVK